MINAENNEVEVVNFIGYVKVQNLRIRENPSSKSKPLGAFKIATQIQCINQSKQKEKIDNYDNYWYKCFTEPSHNNIGWVYGEFIQKDKFNEDEYISKLIEPKISLKKTKPILNTSWTDCKPNTNCAYGVVSYKFTNKLIVHGSDLFNNTYLIKSISDKGNKVLLTCELVMSWSDVQLDSNKNIELEIEFKNSDKEIVVNNNTYYKSK